MVTKLSENTFLRESEWKKSIFTWIKFFNPCNLYTHVHTSVHTYSSPHPGFVISRDVNCPIPPWPRFQSHFLQYKNKTENCFRLKITVPQDGHLQNRQSTILHGCYYLGHLPINIKMPTVISLDCDWNSSSIYKIPLHTLLVNSITIPCIAMILVNIYI